VTGGFNFDAKLRRPSIDLQDIFHAHVGGIDVLSKALLIADRMLDDGKLQAFLDERYAGWDTPFGSDILNGRLSLAQLSDRVLTQRVEPARRSGRQEMLENLVARYLV
jgi:xylose isomerase